MPLLVWGRVARRAVLLSQFLEDSLQDESWQVAPGGCRTPLQFSLFFRGQMQRDIHDSSMTWEVTPANFLVSGLGR